VIRHLPVLLPLVPVLTGLAMLALRDPRALAAVDVAGSLVILVLTLLLAGTVITSGPVAAGPFRADAVALPFLFLIGFLAVCAAIYTVGWMREELETGKIKLGTVRHYYALFHAFIATMLLTVLADNLGVLWIAMEGTTITSAVLVGLRGHRGSLEAAWKYIIVTTIGISFGLFGTVLVYAAAAHARGDMSGDAMSWAVIAGMSKKLDPGIVRIGFLFVLVGYGTKAGLAPVHMWLPDAHSQAPSPVSALLSGALIKCALFGIIRFHTIARGACGEAFSGRLLVLFGLVSVVVATPLIITQRDFKRLLGYHSVEHVGIVALGLGFGGTVGTFGALLHVINHGVTKALVFLVAGNAIGRYRTQDMHAIRGLLAIAPWTGTFLLMGAFSLAGTPPFSIFVSELYVLRAGLGGGHFVAVAVFLLMTVIIFGGLIHHAGRMAFGSPSASAKAGRDAGSTLGAMALLAAVMVLLGVFLPSGLERVLSRATEVILG